MVFIFIIHIDINNSLAAWHQLNQTIAISGNTKIIRLWDAESERKIMDMACCIDSSISTLKFSANGLLIAGYEDGSVQLYDKRVSSNQSRVITYRDHTHSILNAAIRESSSNTLVTACTGGAVRMYDIRKQQQTVKHFEVGTDVTGISIHPTANILAWYNNLLQTYSYYFY